MKTESSPRTQISLPSDCEVAMTRDFDAPREKVFDAWTRPELIKRWFGPPGWVLSGCDVDLRVGGNWRFVGGRPGGVEMTLHGTYREVSRPDRLVYAQSMAGCDGQGAAEAVCTIALTQRGSVTTMINTVRYPSKAVRDSVLQHGATGENMDLAFDKLASLLTSDDNRV